MLYWAEGSKHRNVAAFANSDPAMSLLFCRFMRECLDVGPDRFAVSLNIYTNNGVCTLRVLRSTPILQHIYGAIQEYAGFDQPQWLDGPPRKPRD